MIIGVGCDILEISRIEKLKNSSGSEKVFTENERRHASGRNALLAGDFSVKEAVSKAFGTGVRGFSLTEIEVLRDELGRPYVKLYGRAEALFRKVGGAALHVSISDTGELVMAMAVLEGN